jgi:hypothetical protein
MNLRGYNDLEHDSLERLMGEGCCGDPAFLPMLPLWHIDTVAHARCGDLNSRTAMDGKCPDADFLCHLVYGERPAGVILVPRTSDCLFFALRNWPGSNERHTFSASHRSCTLQAVTT